MKFMFLDLEKWRYYLEHLPKIYSRRMRALIIGRRRTVDIAAGAIALGVAGFVLLKILHLAPPQIEATQSRSVELQSGLISEVVELIQTRARNYEVGLTENLKVQAP